MCFSSVTLLQSECLCQSSLTLSLSLFFLSLLLSVCVCPFSKLVLVRSYCQLLRCNLRQRGLNKLRLEYFFLHLSLPKQKKRFFSIFLKGGKKKDRETKTKLTRCKKKSRLVNDEVPRN